MSREFKSQMVEDRVLVEARCNKCGESCLKRFGDDIAPDFYGAQVGFSTGYYSTALGDGQTFNFDLCEPCLKALMDTFVLPASVQEWL